MSLLNELRKNRSSVFENVSKEMEKVKSGTTYQNSDNRFWLATRDKAGNAAAVIRFLPVIDSDPSNQSGLFVQTFSHSFQSTVSGQWYIEKCPTTIKGKCPVCENNAILWNSGNAADKELVQGKPGQQGRKRQLSYISNVYVIADPLAKENEGKVFLFKYGKKLFDKIMDAMIPQFKDEQGFNPFDPETGANFKLRIRKVEGYTNYEKSVFAECGPLNEDEEQLEAILGKVYNLKEFIDSSNFKPYDQLKERLDFVINSAASAAKANIEEEEEIEVAPKPVLAAPAKLATDEDEESIAEFMGFKDASKNEPISVEPKVVAKSNTPTPKLVAKPLVKPDDDDTDALLKSLMED